MLNVKRFFTKWLRNEEGASGLEYALMAGMVVVAIVSFVAPIRTAVTSIFTQVQAALESAAPTP